MNNERNDMDDELDKLRQQWRQLAVRQSDLEEANRRLSERLRNNRTESMQQSLARRSKAYIWIGLLLPALAPLLYYELHLPVWLCICYAEFGIVMMAFNLRFTIYIRSVQLTSLPVIEAIVRANKIRMTQSRIRMAGIVLGFLLIAAIAYMLPKDDNLPVLLGGALGLIVGLAVSIPRAIANSRLARNLVKSLSDEDEDCTEE